MASYTRLEWVLVAFIAVQTCCGGQSCHDAESCIFDSISSTSDVECYGYRSCKDASQIITTASVECMGSYSCYDATIISGSSVSCHGLFSCANVGSIYAGTYDVSCQGEQSCINTKIISQASSYSVHCSGDRSCQDSRIFTKNTAYFSGHLAGLNSIVYSNATGIDISYSGAFSGYNATVYCATGHTCNIYCYGNGCDNLNGVYCSDGNDASCTINLNDYSLTQLLSIDILNVDFSGMLPCLLDVTMSTYDNSFYPCYTAETNAINCDDYQECQLSTSLNTSNAPICCTAYYGCYQAGDTIEAQIPSNNNLIGNTSIRCDGYRGCHSSGVYGVNGNVYSTGLYSQGTGEMTTGDQELYDIFCTGARSATSATLTICNNLYCAGLLSCDLSSVLNVNNVYAYGQSSLEGSSKTVENIDNLYCGGLWSCYGRQISYVCDSIYAHGKVALYQSDIAHVENNVVIAGHKSGYQSTMYNVTNVYCIGNLSCYGATIRGIHDTIYINGENGISGSSVIISETNFDENGTLLIYINGTNDDGTFDIYCNETDVCKVKCLSSEACSRLYIHSNNGNCYVDCDETNGIACPYNGIWNDWITNEPSMIPSFDPSNMPSQVPSPIPTNYPSSIPSTDPTAEPTANPSSFPSNIPSNIPTNIPTNIPSIEPSFEPSFEPSIEPSIDPSIDPSIMPSKLPTIIPSSIASNIPSNIPSRYPSSMPSISSVDIETTNEKGSDNDNNSSENESSLTVLDTVTIIIVISVSLLLCFGMILLFVHYNKKQENDKLVKELELNKMKSASQGGSNHGSNLVSIDATDRKSSVRMASIENSYDESIEKIFIDLKSLREDDDNDDELYELEGDATNGTNGTNGTSGTSGAGNEETDDNIEIDYSNFDKWTQKQVIIWLKTLLLKNEFDKQVILNFLMQFAKKNVTGATLVQFSANRKLLDAFIQQFASENQLFSIWTAIKCGIQDIVENQQTLK